jgi:hypothetical protein
LACLFLVCSSRVRDVGQLVKMLAAAGTAPYLWIVTMKANLAYWTSILREAERELEAATTRAAMNAAGKKLMEAKTQVKRLQAKAAAVEA